MKLYKQMLDEPVISNDLQLICESGSVDKLKKEACRLAALDGCIEFAWLTGTDSNPEFQFPHELTVNDSYRFIIRDR